jgi:hypothetical protein
MKPEKVEQRQHSTRNGSETSIPDALLPDQYFDRLASRVSDTPEKRLLFAVLLDAVINMQRRNSVGAAEAEQWVRGEDGDDSPFSFRNLCEALGIEASYLARGLLAWRSRAPSRHGGLPVRQFRISHRRVTPTTVRRPKLVTGS